MYDTSLKTFSPWARIPLFSGAYVLTYWTSDVFRLPETGSTPWNPEAGLAVAALALGGPRMLPVLVALHMFCLTVWAPFSTLPWTVVLAAGHVCSLATAIHLLRQDLLAIEQPGSKSATRFVAAALAITAASAVVQMAVAVLGTDWSGSKILRFGMTASVGNMVGILTVFPLARSYPLFTGVHKFMKDLRWRGLSLVLVLLATTCAVFGIPGLDQFKFFYLVFVPVIALAILYGMTGAAISVLAASICMIAVLSFRDYSATAVAELQALMIVLAITGLVLGATIDERQRTHEENVTFLSRLQESEDALMRASRISLASEMATAVAHELAQPLSAARSHVRTLKRRLALARRDRAKDTANIDAAIQQIDAAAATIRNMREFLRRGDLERAPFDIRQLMDMSTELIRPELRRAAISLTVEGPAKLPPVNGNRTQISQVLLNLLRNAKESIVEGGMAQGRITVSTTLQRPGLVEVRVTDNGPGVPEALRAQLFTPLRSTKADGLGLGLSLSNSIVLVHGGQLWHDPSFSRGARFCFTIPVAPQDIGPA